MCLITHCDGKIHGAWKIFLVTQERVLGYRVFPVHAMAMVAWTHFLGCHRFLDLKRSEEHTSELQSL